MRLQAEIAKDPMGTSHDRNSMSAAQQTPWMPVKAPGCVCFIGGGEPGYINIEREAT